MKVPSEMITVLLFLTCHEVLSVTRRTVDILNGNDDVQNKIENMKGFNGTEVEVNDVKFFIYGNRDDVNSNKSVDNTIFLFHGWTQDAESCPWYRPLTELLLMKFPNAQVVQVDFGKAAAAEYEKAVSNIEGVGLIVSNMIHKMVKEGVPSDKMVLIGHSLGGQVAGWIGKEYRSMGGKILPRIIALDPAGPIFVKRSDSRRLNKYDADVVFVIHSDIKRFGFPTNCGTIDFFPNGGFDQPGCPKQNSSSPDEKKDEWCSHRRATDLFIAAFKNPEHFMATKCVSNEVYESHKCFANQKVSMGDWKTNQTESYYLTTEDVPFIK